MQHTSGLLTREEAAKWLRVHARTLDRMRDRGEVAAVKIGRRWLYRTQTLEAFVAARERTGICG